MMTALLMCAIAQGAQSWESPQPWKDLRRKMTESQVADLLGSPKETETVGQNLVWYYQDTPKRKEEQIIWRPKTAFVHFKQVSINRQRVFLLFGWKPPQIDEVQTPPNVEEKRLPDNPLAQLEEIERVYMQQLQLLDGQSSNTPSPAPPQPLPGRPSPNLPPASGRALVEWFNNLPRQWVLVGIGGICFVTALCILWPAKYKRKKRRRPFDL